MSSTDAPAEPNANQLEPAQQAGARAALRKAEREKNLTPEQRQIVEQRKATSYFAQQLRSAQWAKENLSYEGIEAMALWCYQYGIEPVTEIDYLGSKPYPNAAYYQRKLGELINAGRIRWHRKRWIHVDARVEALAAAGNTWGKQEQEERLHLRIEHAVPENSEAACVVSIQHVNEETPTHGVKFHDPKRKKKDPVGDDWPIETWETRAYRRAMLPLQRLERQFILAPASIPDLKNFRVMPPEAERALNRTIATVDGSALQRDERAIAHGALAAGTPAGSVVQNEKGEVVAVHPDPYVGGTSGERKTLESLIVSAPEGTTGALSDVTREPGEEEDDDEIDDRWITQQDDLRKAKQSDLLDKPDRA